MSRSAAPGACRPAAPQELMSKGISWPVRGDERHHGMAARSPSMLAGMNDVAAIAALPGAAQSATSTIHRSLDNLKKDASVVARAAGGGSGDTVQALVDARQQLLYTKAAAKVIHASDEMTQSLLDIRA